MVTAALAASTLTSKCSHFMREGDGRRRVLAVVSQLDHGVSTMGSMKKFANFGRCGSDFVLT